MQLQGKRKSKAFLAETERQVRAHLEKHLAMFPAEDSQAREILKRMYEDEGEHASWAENDLKVKDGGVCGGLSKSEKRAMGVMSKVMIESSKRIQLKIDRIHINDCPHLTVNNDCSNFAKNPM